MPRPHEIFAEKLYVILLVKLTIMKCGDYRKLPSSRVLKIKFLRVCLVLFKNY